MRISIYLLMILLPFAWIEYQTCAQNLLESDWTWDLTGGSFQCINPPPAILHVPSIGLNISIPRWVSKYMKT